MYSDGSNLIKLLIVKFLVFRSNANASILEAEFRPGLTEVKSDGSGADGDRTAIGRVFDGVDDNVKERLLNEGGVGVDVRGVS